MTCAVFYLHHSDRLPATVLISAKFAIRRSGLLTQRICTAACRVRSVYVGRPICRSVRPVVEVYNAVIVHINCE